MTTKQVKAVPREINGRFGFVELALTLVVIGLTVAIVLPIFD
jgi:hypothetical protein